MDLLLDVLIPFNKLGGFVGLIEHGMIMSVCMQGAVQHQWDPMVEIPTPHERDYGRSSYEGICCKCVEHRGKSHPMCTNVWSCTCIRYARSFC
jgi:hypothetical protein